MEDDAENDGHCLVNCDLRGVLLGSIDGGVPSFLFWQAFGFVPHESHA